MADFHRAIAVHTTLSVEDQVRAGTPTGGDMDAEHKEFLALIVRLVDSKEIDPYKPETFLKKDVYDAMPEEWRNKTDAMLPNLADSLRHAVDFYKSSKTPNACPQLETMIEHLWQMKQRIEETYDVFKF